MRALNLSLVGATLMLCTSARADTFVLDYTNRPAVDPAANFEADCLGTTEAPDCASRAAALEAELVEVLGQLEGRRDEETVALFAAAVTNESDNVKQLGLRYFSRHQQLPATLWASVKEFFFGPDPGVGQPSAEILGFSDDGVDQQLSDRYLEQRPNNAYTGNLPSEPGADDEWALACANDALLDAVDAFPEAQRFAPATRLLMIDRILPNNQNPMLQTPVSGFVTDAAKADVEAHFSKLLGKQPYPPIATSEARLQTLNAELTALTSKVMTGDKQAIERLQTISKEIVPIQESLTVGGVLGLEDMSCADHVFWLDGSAESAYTGAVPRAVVVGTDALLNRTVIRYFGGNKGNGAQPNNPDGGVRDDDVDPVPGAQDGGSPDPNSQTPGKKSDGCSLAAGGGSASGAWFVLLMAVAMIGRFARRVRWGGAR